jgi:hypothetical protein
MIIIKIKEKIEIKIRKHDSGEKKSKMTMVKTTVTKKGKRKKCTDNKLKRGRKERRMCF